MSRSKATYGADDATLVDSSSAYQTTIAPSISSCRLYHVYHSLFRHHYTVHNADKEQLYHVHNSTWTPNKPDLSVHAGTTTQGPVVAACKFLHFSRHCKVAIGNPDTPNSVDWEDLTALSHLHTRYRFQMSLRSEHGVERRSFIWKNTSSVGAGGAKPSKLSWRNYKLVDEPTDRLIAVYTASVWSQRSLGSSKSMRIMGRNST